ncbi:MAG: hypothetical protein JSV89_18675 [Spirochaetaceae bacterium]|nr:MAG: hypothetical protein JSV89_18675 [Spirochaetaceae bacterium]
MRKLAYSTIALLLLLPSVCPADSSAPTLLPPQLLEQLLSEGELRNSLQAGSPLTLIPDVAARLEIEERIRAVGFSVGTEVLLMYRDETVDFDAPDSRLKIYNILRSISTMRGIEYYSASRKRMRTLFAQSYVIAGPDSTEPLPDPLVREIPANSELYVFQEDLTFGDNVYLWEYRYSGEYFLMVNRNLTTMRYFLLPMVKPLESVTFILLIPAGSEILFYGITGARTMRLLGLERSREDSFYNRLKAIYGWFSERMVSTF